jgi:DNA-directed RNA polymerase subunit RPC12/RpoP
MPPLTPPSPKNQPKEDEMTTQGSLFQELSPIEQAIQRAKDRGQRISPWVVFAMKTWSARKVRSPKKGNASTVLYEDVGILPVPCDCMNCGEPALIFPPEDDETHGYCICPHCSFKTLATRMADDLAKKESTSSFSQEPEGK